MLYTKNLRIFYKIVQIVDDDQKYYRNYIWNLVQDFKYEERARVTESLEFELFGVASSTTRRSSERYLLAGSIFLIALTSLILQVNQFLTSDRMLKQTLESIQN